MQHVEGQPRFSRPFIRVVDIVTRRGDTSLLTREQRKDFHQERKNIKVRSKQLDLQLKEETKTYLARVDQTLQEELQRVKSDPKIDLGTIEEWRLYAALWDRLEREAAARGDKEIDYSQLPWRPQPQSYESLSPEQRNYQNHTVVRQLHYEMAKETNDAQFNLIAASIKKDVWRDKSLHASSIEINPLDNVNVHIKPDGSPINRSRFGATISYVHKDAGNDELVSIPQKEELSFGIGYFGDRTAMIPEAQQTVSDAEIERGVKSYFIQRSYTTEEKGKVVRKTELIVVPVAHEDSMKAFVKYLYKSAKSLAPTEVLPQAKRRLETSRRKTRAATAA